MSGPSGVSKCNNHGKRYRISFQIEKCAQTTDINIRFDLEKCAQTTILDIVSMSKKQYSMSLISFRYRFQNDIEYRSISFRYRFQNDIGYRSEFDIVSISFDIVFAAQKKQEGFQDFFRDPATSGKSKNILVERAHLSIAM